jgi:nucleoside-diphosphate-sugar epimerase
LGWGTNYNSKDNQDLTATGIKAAKRHTIKSDEYFNENVEYLKSIIEFAKAKNITVLLFTSPAYKTYVRNLDNTQLSRSINAANHLTDTYSNAVYFNLLNDTIFTENDFHDSDHLNEIGAKKLTVKIDSLLMATVRNRNIPSL